MPTRCEFLLDAGADLNAQTASGHTALHHAWNTDTARALLDAGANSNARTKHGQTPLHLLTGPDRCKLLINAGADPNARTTDGQTPLHRAAENSDHETIRILLDAGADPERTDQERTDASAPADGSRTGATPYPRWSRPEHTDNGWTDAAPLFRTRRSLRDSAGPVQFGSQPEHKKLGRAKHLYISRQRTATMKRYESCSTPVPTRTRGTRTDGHRCMS